MFLTKKKRQMKLIFIIFHKIESEYQQNLKIKSISLSLDNKVRNLTYTMSLSTVPTSPYKNVTNLNILSQI